jgi:hypothetical protein
MRKLLTAFVLVLVIALHVSAKSAGTTGFELFRTDGWARSAALGGSQVAVGGDLLSLYANPAGLGDMTGPQASAGFFKHVLDINAGSLAYARPIPSFGVAALGITYLDYGKFDRATEFGERTGEFGASDVLVTAAAARELATNISGGAALKFLNETIDSYSASALALDVGFLYHTGYKGWDVGGGVYNLGFATSAFLSKKDDLPTLTRLGFSTPLEHLPVRFSAAAEYLAAEGVRGAGGLEFTFTPFLQGRIGYNSVGIDQRVGLSKDALAGFSGGIGIHIKSISVDYALTSEGSIGYLHRFTIATVFPNSK